MKSADELPADEGSKLAHIEDLACCDLSDIVCGCNDNLSYELLCIDYGMKCPEAHISKHVENGDNDKSLCPTNTA
jgi:hypothetical protein